jgi:hypothetical protein
LTQKYPLVAMAGQVLDVLAGQNSTSGGVSDSAANAWQANPAGRPPSAPSTPVMTVTPVQKWPSTCR